MIIILIISIIPFIIAKDSFYQKNQKVKLNLSIEQRTKSIVDPLEDVSLLMRVEMSYRAFQRFLGSPIVGKGFGDYLKYKIFKVNSEPNFYIDNTWFYILWKGGIIGFLLFAWVYFRFFKASYFVLNNTKTLNIKIIHIGLISGFIGIFFLAFLSPLLIKYKTNVLIAFLFAYVEFERNKILNSGEITLDEIDN